MTRQMAISRYENMMMGKQKLMLSGSEQEKQTAALDIFHYVITDLLGWTPEEAQDCLNKEIAHKMHLDILIKHYIHCPKDIQKDSDYDYFVAMAFPHDVQYDERDGLIAMYKRIMRGEQQRFPQHYFNGDHGRYKASLLLMYVIDHNIPVNEKKISDLYALFADGKRINRLFKKWKLDKSPSDPFSSPLEYLHYSLPSDLANDFLYSYYSFSTVYVNDQKDEPDYRQTA